MSSIETVTRPSLEHSRQGVAAVISRVLVLGLVLLLSICASVDAEEDASDDNAPQIRLSEYTLAPGDRLKVVVFDQEQLSSELIVDGAGEIRLPIAGNVKVGTLTVAEAEQIIQERFADGILVQPTVSVRIDEYRPISVTGYVRTPGSYPFRFGQSVKAAIAAAGGQGRPNDQLMNIAIADFIAADERIRVLETSRLGLLMRKARLEAQRDELAEFVVPQLVGFEASNLDVGAVYAAENDTFLRLNEAYRRLLGVLHRQRPRIEAEIQAVTDQVAKERQRLTVISKRVADLEGYRSKGFVRSSEVNLEQREEARIDAEVARLEAALARLGRDLGDLDIKAEEVEASFRRQVAAELQETLQRLREIDASLGPARELRDVKALGAGSIDEVEPDSVIFISRTRQSGIVTFKAAADALLQPGDVIEVKRKRQPSGDLSNPSTQASPSLGNTNAALTPADSQAGADSTPR